MKNVAFQGVAASVYVLFLLVLIVSLISVSLEHIIFIYIIMFPLGDILPVSGILLRGINLIEIVTIILFLFYFNTNFLEKRRYNQFEKLALMLSFFFIVIYFGTFYLKVYNIYGMGGISKTTFFIRCIKLLFHFLSIFIIIDSFVHSYRVKLWVKRGLLFGFLFLGTNIYLTPIFHKLGLSIGQLGDYVEGNIFESRAVGLFSGDANFFAHYMVVGFGYFLSIIEKKQSKIVLLFLFIMLSAIAVSASRAAILTILLILILYLIRQIHGLRIKQALIIIALVPISYTLFGSTLESRLYELQGVGESIETYSRFKFQMIYIKEMIMNKYLLISGYWDETQLYKSVGRWRTPHNQFLGMVFWGGLPYLFVFLVILHRISKLRIPAHISEYGLSISYPFIGFCSMYLFNPNEFIMYFPIVLIVSYQYFKIDNRLNVE